MWPVENTWWREWRQNADERPCEEGHNLHQRGRPAPYDGAARFHHDLSHAQGNLRRHGDACLFRIRLAPDAAHPEDRGPGAAPAPPDRVRGNIGEGGRGPSDPL